MIKEYNQFDIYWAHDRFGIPFIIRVEECMEDGTTVKVTPTKEHYDALDGMEVEVEDEREHRWFGVKVY